MVSRIAKCRCGALTVTVAGEPEHNHACSCTRCQRSTGSVMGWAAWFAADDVIDISGRYSVWYRNGEADPDVMSVFCSICGGGGFWKSGDYLPGTIGFNVGTFADPDFPPPAHVHWSEVRPKWIGIKGDIELLEGN